MGQRSGFICPGCGYEARVSGGLDAGFEFTTHTVSCPKCRELSDVIVLEGHLEVIDARDMPFADEREGEPVHRDWMPERIRCGRDGRHTAQLWRHPGPCPRCGTRLVRGGPSPIDWD